MFLKAQVDFECSSLDTIFHRQDILASIRPWSLYQKIFGGHKFENLSKSMSQHVTSILGQKSLDIGYMDYYNHFQFWRNHGLLYPWTLL
jgi:hypothetical protein